MGDESYDKDIPAERIAKVVAEREEIRARLATVQAELTAAQAARAQLTALQAEFATATTAAQAAERSWARDRTLLESGLLDPEARDVAVLLHERIPVENRPPLGEWLAAMRADPTRIPPALTAYLAPPATANARPPLNSRTVDTVPNASQQVTQTQLREAGERARRLGTPEALAEYRTIRDKIVSRT